MTGDRLALRRLASTWGRRSYDEDDVTLRETRDISHVANEVLWPGPRVTPRRGFPLRSLG